MYWLQFGILFITIIRFLWISKRDYKEFAAESKDLHGRLCALEEKYAQMMQRFMERK